MQFYIQLLGEALNVTGLAIFARSCDVGVVLEVIILPGHVMWVWPWKSYYFVGSCDVGVALEVIIFCQVT